MRYGILSAEKDLSDDYRSIDTLNYYIRDMEYIPIFMNTKESTIKWTDHNGKHFVRPSARDASRRISSLKDRSKTISVMEKLISMIQQDDVVMFVDICQLSKITSEQIYLYERFLEKGINLEFIRNPWLDSENFTVSALEETANTKRILENVIANTGKAISSTDFISQLKSSQYQASIEVKKTLENE